MPRSRGRPKTRRGGPGQEAASSASQINAEPNTRSEPSEQAGRSFFCRDWQGNHKRLDLTRGEVEGWDRASSADAEWFKAHPRRSHRLRPAIPHELAHSDTAGKWIAVRQVKPGFRVRVMFEAPSPPPDDEAVAHAMYDLIHEHGAAGNALIPVETIMARAYAMGGGGLA